MVRCIQEGADREDVRVREKGEEGWERGRVGKGGRRVKMGERRPDEERDKGEEWERREEQEKGRERLENWRREKHPHPPTQSKQYRQSYLYKIIFFYFTYLI